MTEPAPTAKAPRTPLLDRVIFKIGRTINKMIFWTLRADRPAFYPSPQAVYPQLKILDDNYEIIREEMERLLPDSALIPRFHEIDPQQTYISATVNPDKAWRVFTLKALIGAPAKNQAKCPQTTALLNRVPGVMGAAFSILEPGKSIPAHCADDNEYLRYHLPLRVPRDNPPSLRVRDETHVWAEGKSILFDDTLEHEVFNESSEHRVILMVDLYRPLPLPLHAASVFFLQFIFPFVSAAEEILTKV